MNPCVALCYARFGKEYTPECDNYCDYAKLHLESKRLRDELEQAKAGVRHGHWINFPPYECGAGYKKGQQCSECYTYYVSDGTTPWPNHKYCAECGAKMDGKEEFYNGSAL